MATDPVCGMTVDEKEAAAKVEYLGNTYYFCSTDCHKTFTAAPQKYAKAAGDDKHGGQHK